MEQTIKDSFLEIFLSKRNVPQDTVLTQAVVRMGLMVQFAVA